MTDSLRPLLSYEDPSFINSPDGRVLRILAEYTGPLARFRRQRIQDTVVFFGSARIHAFDEANRKPEFLDSHGSRQSAPAAERPAPEEQAAVEMARYYEDARRLAAMLTQWSMTIRSKRHRFVVTSGGGPGIMEAANRGASEAGGKTIGLNIRLPLEQHPNPYITPELNLEFHYFFMRKYWFAYLAKALVVFPGGFGTLDEMFELITLSQTHKLAKEMTILVYGSQYWNEVIDFDMLVKKGAIAPEDRGLFQFADTPEDAFAVLKENLSRRYIKPEEMPEAAKPEAAFDVETEMMLCPEIAKTRR